MSIFLSELPAIPPCPFSVFYQFFENVIQCTLIIFNSLPQLPKLFPLPSPYICLFFNPSIRHNWCCPNTLECVTFTGERATHHRPHSQRKLTLSQQSSATHSSSVRDKFHNELLSGSILCISWADNHSSFEFTSAVDLSYLEDSVLF